MKKEYRPLSPWEYFGYSILFNIPLIGLILLLIFSFSNSNINRRNYARSYFCVYILIIILIMVALACGLTFSTIREFVNWK